MLNRLLDKLQSLALRIPASTLFFICLVLTGIAASSIYERYRLEDQMRFERVTDTVKQAIQSRLDIYVTSLNHTRGFLDVEFQRINRAKFAEFIKAMQISRNYPGAQGIGFARVLKPTEVKNYEVKMRGEGLSSYEVHPQDTDSIVAVTYLEPLDWRNRRAMGFNMISEPVRRVAMDLARDTGNPRGSGKVTLAQESSKNPQPGFLVFVPVYKRGASTDTVEERRKAHIGFIYSPFRISDLFDQIADQIRDEFPQSHFNLYDGKETPENRVYSTDRFGNREPKSSDRYNTVTISIVGHPWNVKVWAPPTFNTNSHKSLLRYILLLGSIISFLVYLIVKFIGRYNQTLQVDISLRKKTEEALLATSQKFRATFENAGVGIAHVDNDGRWIEINNKYCEILGYTRDELLKMSFKDITHPDDLRDSLDKTAKLRAGVFPSYEADKRYIRKDGSTVWVHLTVTVVRNSAGNPLYSIVSSQDITEIKKADEQIRQAKEVAEEASRAKSRFLANMSHEIRTPLGVIIGFADLALDTQIRNEEARNYIHAIKRNGQELTRIIGEVLDLSKIEANRLEIERVRFPLVDLLEETLSLLDLRAREKGIILNLNIKEPMPELIESDPTRLRQILINLIGNAIKFTEKGFVKVVVEMLSVPVQGVPIELKFCIEDTGIGIPAEKRQNLFQPFMQADSSTTRRFGGTGLGLMLSKQLAKALGGDLTLEMSEIGKGSRFVFTIKAGSFLNLHQETSSRHQVVEENIDSSLIGKKILLVEDSPDNQILVTRYLRGAGAEVDVADNGQQGMEKALQGNYDLVLMDIQMPVLDGHNATRSLRDRGYVKPIIALTAHAFREERERAMGAGFSDYLTKPLSRKSLLKSAQKALEH